MTFAEISMKMNRIKEVIQTTNSNQSEIARLVGVSKNAMSLFCRNESQPQMDTLFKIARALNVQPGELLVTVDWDTVTDENLAVTTAGE